MILRHLLVPVLSAAYLAACGVTPPEAGPDASDASLRDTELPDSVPFDTSLLEVSVDVPTGDISRVDAMIPDTGVADMGVPDMGMPDAGLRFAPGTICNASAMRRTPPAVYPHVIIFMMENRGYTQIHGNANAPYYNSLVAQCGSSSGFVDNLFTSDQLSLPHYLALSSGSNCNTGLGTTTQTPGSTGCITDDNDATAHRLSTPSIFGQVSSWKAYQESMGTRCAATSGTLYATKHNPPPYYSALASSCATRDIGIAHLTCSTTVGRVCSTPNDAFTQDLAGDTLPALSFITPDLVNDMHDGTTSQGDNYLSTYLPLIFQSRAYLRGDVALYIMWDESSPGTPQPNLFISPYTPPTQSRTAMNLFSVLRAMESQLGITTYLGCAGGTPPGGIGTCPAGSTTDIRPVFNF